MSLQILDHHEVTPPPSCDAVWSRWASTMGFVLLMLAGCSSSDAARGGTGGASANSGGTSGTGGAGMGTGGAGGGNVATACPEAPAKLAAGCTGSDCHNPGKGDVPDYASPGVAARLINVNANLSNPCNGQTKLVNPSRPASGVLFDRLTTETCGGLQMPPSYATADQQLSAADRASFVACLKAWLEPQLQP